MRRSAAGPDQSRKPATLHTAGDTVSEAQDVSSLLVTRIVIEKSIDADGADQFTAEFINAAGDEPSLIEIIGMLELAKSVALNGSCDCGDEDDDDE
jgi:hypothetical protein